MFQVHPRLMIWSLAYRCSVAGVSAAAVMTAEVAASAEIGVSAVFASVR